MPLLQSSTKEAAPISKFGARQPKDYENLVTLFLFLLAIALYSRTLLNGFVYDDNIQILHNPYIKSWHYLPQILRGDVWSFLGPARTSNYYRPLFSLTTFALWHIFGDLPVGYHLLNVLLNAIVVVCVYLTGKALFRDSVAAIAGALVFCLHPVHTQAVSWISAVSDIQITLLLLLAFLLYLQPAPLTTAKQLAVALCFASALLIKEPALMFVVLLPFYDLLVRNQARPAAGAQLARRHLPLLLVVASYLLVRTLLLGNLAPVLQRPQMSWKEAFYSAFALMGEYARMLLLPTNLSTFHTFHKSTSLLQPATLLGLAVAAIFVAAVLLLRRRYPEVAFALAWIAIPLLPVLNPRWMPANVLAERYLYLPSVGFAWAAGWVLGKLRSAAQNSQRWRLAGRLAFALPAVALSLLCAASVWTASADWHDDFRLYTSALKTNPDSWDVRMNLGILYLTQKSFPASERELLLSTQFKPDAYYAWNALGCLYLEEGRLEKAEHSFQQGLAIQSAWPDLHFNYGRLLAQQGHDSQALMEFRKAVADAPLNARAHLLLAQALAGSGADAEAETEFRATLSLSPDIAAKHGLLDLLLKSGRQVEAESLLKDMSLNDPYDAKAHLQLGRLLEAEGSRSQALKEYQAVLLSDPHNAEAKAASDRLLSPPSH